MAEIINHSKKYRCQKPLCYFETDSLEKLQDHQREHKDDRRNLYG